MSSIRSYVYFIAALATAASQLRLTNHCSAPYGAQQWLAGIGRRFIFLFFKFDIWYINHLCFFKIKFELIYTLYQIRSFMSYSSSIFKIIIVINIIMNYIHILIQNYFRIYITRAPESKIWLILRINTNLSSGPFL